MRLFSVLAELGVDDVCDLNKTELLRDVAFSPDDPSTSTRLVRLDELKASPARAHGGMTIAVAPDEIPESYRRVSPNLIVCTSTLSFDAVRERFERIPSLIMRLELAKGRLFDAFSQTHNIQQFVKRAGSITGNPMVVVNNDGKIVASTGNFPDERPDLAAQDKAGYIDPRNLAELESVREVSRQNHFPHRTLNTRDGLEWVTSVIFYKGLEMGTLDAIKLKGRVSGFDLELADYTSHLAGIILDRADSEKTSVLNAGASVLNDIINGKFLHEEAARAQLEAAGFDAGDMMCLMIIRGKASFASPNFHQQVGRMAKRVFPQSIWLVRRNTLLLLVPMSTLKGTGFPYYRVQKGMFSDNSAFVDMLRNNSLKAYVSDPFAQIITINDYMQQCRRLIGSVDQESADVFYLKDHRYRALANAFAGSFSLESLLDKRVLAVAHYDQEHGSSYYKTLRTFIEHPNDNASACRELGTHRNTYAYRLNKIREAFWIDLSDPDDLLDVAFTFNVLDGFSDLGLPT